ncbi:uncharacterized protein LOC113388351 [Ctenocephalides felis]|uniref:uncharacterized protein LOC113388351 n=1 Tax=Ctenocephalides felis TaxID=7515 RepID=UPI000E6E396E|nr:uncharacterized protein LOC113388351 [Ctenocephalides felis]
MACTIGVIVQISKCITKLIRPPIVSHSYFDRNDSLYYPAVTLCRDPPYKMDVMEKYGLGPTATMTSEWKNFPFDSANLSTFWTEATYDVSDYFTPTIGGFNGSVDNMEFKSGMFLQNGQCHTIIPKMPVLETGRFSGYSFILKHDMRHLSETPSRLPPGWHVHIHEPSDPFSES